MQVTSQGPIILFLPVGFCEPIYAGVLISSILYGVTCLQTFHYFRTYKDRWLISVTVLILWCLDSVHQILVSLNMWINCLDLEENVVVLEWFDQRTRNLAAILLTNTFVTVLVNGFLLWRLWTLSGNKRYSGLILVLLIGHLALNLTLSIHLLLSPIGRSSGSASYSFFDYSLPYYVESVAGLAIDCILDVLLATGLVYYLFKSKTGFRTSGNLITKLIIMTVSSGLLTSTFMIGELGSMIHSPTSEPALFYFFTFVVGKMYINALLTSLNTRERLKGGLNNEQGESFPLGARRSSRFFAGITPDKTIEIVRSVPSSTQCNPNSSKLEYPDAPAISEEEYHHEAAV